jgi:hypothetical protein
MLAISPFLLEKLTFLTTEFNNVHPELQVVILDTAYMSCLSNDDKIRKEGSKILTSISESSYSNNEICENFRLNTWQSVGKWSVSPQELGQTSHLDNVSDSKIALSSGMTEEKFKIIRGKWAEFLIANPKDYLQIKIIQFSQVLVVGDTFGIRAIEVENRILHISKLFFLPYDLFISFHILSPIVTLISGLILIFVRYKNLKIKEIFIETNLFVAYAFVILWAMLTTVAYIGDNGRYLYLSTLVFHLLLLLSLPYLENSLEKSKDKCLVNQTSNE